MPYFWVKKWDVPLSKDFVAFLFRKWLHRASREFRAILLLSKYKEGIWKWFFICSFHIFSMFLWKFLHVAKMKEFIYTCHEFCYSHFIVLVLSCIYSSYYSSSQWFSTGGRFLPQRTVSRAWGHFWLPLLWRGSCWPGVGRGQVTPGHGAPSVGDGPAQQKCM